MAGALTRSLGRGGSPALASSTRFLCRFSASPPVDEVSGNTGTLVGGATVNTGSHWVTTDGTGDWVTFPYTSAYDLAGDFTLEVHVKLASSQVGGIVAHVNSATEGTVGRWGHYCPGNGDVDFYADNVSGVKISSWGGAANNTMRHLALTRSGNTWRAFLDGSLVRTDTVSGTIGSQNKILYIGTDPFSTTGRDIAADIGRVKISNVALWTASFTPPAITDP